MFAKQLYEEYTEIVNQSRKKLEDFQAVWAIHLADLRGRIASLEETPEEAFNEADEEWSNLNSRAQRLAEEIDVFDSFVKTNCERELRTLVNAFFWEANKWESLFGNMGQKNP